MVSYYSTDAALAEAASQSASHARVPLQQMRPLSLADRSALILTSSTDATDTSCRRRDWADGFPDNPRCTRFVSDTDRISGPALRVCLAGADGMADVLRPKQSLRRQPVCTCGCEVEEQEGDCPQNTEADSLEPCCDDDMCMPISLAA